MYDLHLPGVYTDYWEHRVVSLRKLSLKALKHASFCHLFVFARVLEAMRASPVSIGAQLVRVLPRKYAIALRSTSNNT